MANRAASNARSGGSAGPPVGARERLIAFERVSTARQGASGLGLAAQRKAIEGFAASRDGRLVGRFTEVESGRRADRPELARALDLARLTGATLLIARHRISLRTC